MPPKVERCVEALLARKSFRPGQDPKERKSSAYAICQAAQKMGDSEVDFLGTITSLPDDIDTFLDDAGFIRLQEVDGMQFDDDVVELDEDAAYSLFFKDEEAEDGSFSRPCKIKLAHHNKKEEDEEYTEQLVPIEMLRAGNFRHPRYGDIKFDRKYFTQAIENFINNVIERELSFDSVHAPQEGATAWVKRLGLASRKFRDGKRRPVLTGDVELTDWGRKLVEGKRFKYFSVEVRDNFRDKETNQPYGPTVMGGGMTNRPFIPGMQSILMSEDEVANADQDGKPAIEADVDEPETPATEEEHTQDSELSELIRELDVIKTEDKSFAQAEQKRPPDSQLPDAAFALVKKNADGDAAKRSLPHHGPQVKSATENDSIDLGRLRNALARADQVEGFSQEELAGARRHLEAHARALLESRRDRVAADEQGVNNMDIEAQIADLRKQLSEIGADSEQSKMLSEQLSTLEKAQEAMQAAIDERTSEIEKKFEDRIAAQEQKAQENEERAKNLAEQAEAATKELAEIRTQKKVQDVQIFCDKLVADKHYPAVVEEAKKILLADVETGTTITLSEDDKDVSISLMDAVKRIFDSMPEDARVNLSEELIGEGNDTPPDNDKKDGDNGKVKLDDGTEVDFMSDEAVNDATKRAGYNTKQ